MTATEKTSSREEKMDTVYITKYALTLGIQRKTGTISELRHGARYFMPADSDTSMIPVPVDEEHWFCERTEAVKRAEEMKEAKVKSLLVELARYKAMEFI